MLSVVFFSTSSGNEPVREWLRRLTAEDRAVIGEDLRTVQLGFPLGIPLCRPLGGGLFEVRSTLPSRREARLIFFPDGDMLVVVGGIHQEDTVNPELRNTGGSEEQECVREKQEAMT